MIIALEGLDKSGKHSAREYLKRKLEESTYSVGTLEFPDYESFFGKLIRKWLRNEIECDKKTFELLMYSDKVYSQDKILEMELNYDFVLIDRYVLSQLAYGSNEVDEDWLIYLTSSLIQPDLTIYFDVDVDVSMKRKGQHGDNDKYESDFEFLAKVKNKYNEYLSVLNESVRIDANQDLETVYKELDKWVIQIIMNHKSNLDKEYGRI